MTLLQLTEPIFQYVCRLNRLARHAGGPKAGDTTSFVKKSGEVVPIRGASLDYAVAHAEIKALFEDMMAKAATDMRLSQQARKVELPLIFFVDSMISESKLSFASQWNQNRMAYDRQELAGDEKFFDFLEETMKESGDGAAERLAVFYSCIGLGFTGIYFKQPEFLRKTLLSIAPRIRHLVENDQNARICPEAYEGVDMRNLVEPPSRRMVLVAMVFIGFTVAVLISYVVMYRQAYAHLNTSIAEVRQQDLSTQSK